MDAVHTKQNENISSSRLTDFWVDFHIEADKKLQVDVDRIEVLVCNSWEYGRRLVNIFSYTIQELLKGIRPNQMSQHLYHKKCKNIPKLQVFLLVTFIFFYILFGFLRWILYEVGSTASGSHGEGQCILLVEPIGWAPC